MSFTVCFMAGGLKTRKCKGNFPDMQGWKTGFDLGKTCLQRGAAEISSG